MAFETFAIVREETTAVFLAVTGESGTGTSALSTIVIGAFTLIVTSVALWLLAGGRFGGRK